MNRPRRDVFLSLSLLAVTAMATACARQTMPDSGTPAPAPASASAAFGTTQVLAVGKSVAFADGLQVALDRINDSRCPADVQCVWAGELAAELTLRGGDVGAAGRTLSLGTHTTRAQTVAGYLLTLSAASADTATLTVTKPGAAGGQAR